MLIGRESEVKALNDLYRSGFAELVALYGRRRVGKTFLVDEAFKDRITFRHAGLSPIDTTYDKEGRRKSRMKDQLRHFHRSLDVRNQDHERRVFRRQGLPLHAGEEEAIAAGPASKEGYRPQHPGNDVRIEAQRVFRRFRQRCMSGRPVLLLIDARFSERSAEFASLKFRGSIPLCSTTHSEGRSRGILRSGSGAEDAPRLTPRRLRATLTLAAIGGN